MHDIRHRIGVIAPIEQVYERVATIDGLAAWWTSDTTGESKVGGVITFRFGDEPGRSMDMEVVELTPPGRVVWRCTRMAMASSCWGKLMARRSYRSGSSFVTDRTAPSPTISVITVN